MRPMKAQTLDGTRRLGDTVHTCHSCLACMILSRLIVLQVTNIIRNFLQLDLSQMFIKYSLLIRCEVFENGQGCNLWVQGVCPLSFLLLCQSLSMAIASLKINFEIVLLQIHDI